jgi:monoamine oxidase
MAHYTRTDLETREGPKAAAPSIPEETDVLIVGAGMSGLYVAWRLLDQEKPPSVCILEKMDRTGGRLDSDVVHFPDHEDVKEEEGGMRFTFDGMDDLMTLFVELGLEDQIVPFPMNSGGNNRLYFRGRAFTNREAKEGGYKVWSELYNLDEAERGINPSEMINTVFNRLLAANPQLKLPADGRTPEFWQCFRLDCSWHGVTLKDWTLWGLLDEMGYSNECITMLYRVLGFNGTFLSEMSAGEAFQLLADFPADPQFRTLADGFSGLPNALVEQIGMDSIFLDTAVHRIEKVDGGYTVAYTRDGEQAEIRAKKIVLAIPRLALEKLYVGSDLLNRMESRGDAEALWDNLQTTTQQSLLKINLYYDKAWWGNDLSGRPDVSFGPNFADLPLGSVYPFYAIDPALSAAAEYHEWLVAHNQPPSDIGADKLAEINADKYKRPAALTIYCDYLNINFWRGLQETGEMFDSSMQREASDKTPQTIYPASVEVVAAATSLFKKLFNTHHVPQPVLTSARIWSGTTRFDAPPAQQVGFGVHQWGLHADDRAVIEALVEPLPNVYTCGEAFSDFQGWVEGALRSADLVLGQGFHLKSISENYQEEHGGRLAKEELEERYAERMTEGIRRYIDPDFEVDAAGTALDMTRTAPTVHEQFGVALTYLHEFALPPKP